MQTCLTASPQIGADHDSDGQPDACAQPSAQPHHKTDFANAAAPPGRIELRTVYRMSLFGSGMSGN
jgi:hypothetical protein